MFVKFLFGMLVDDVPAFVVMQWERNEFIVDRVIHGIAGDDEESLEVEAVHMKDLIYDCDYEEAPHEL